jgi:hypothetical protein
MYLQFKPSLFLPRSHFQVVALTFTLNRRPLLRLSYKERAGCGGRDEGWVIKSIELADLSWRSPWKASSNGGILLEFEQHLFAILLCTWSVGFWYSYKNIFKLIEELNLPEWPLTDWTTSGFWSPKVSTSCWPLHTCYKIIEMRNGWAKALRVYSAYTWMGIQAGNNLPVHGLVW